MLILVVGCSSVTDNAIFEQPFPSANCSIAELRNMVTSDGIAYLKEDIVVVGAVSSTASEEHYSPTIVVEDETGAVEVMLGLSPMYYYYPEGLHVALRLHECALGYSYGVLQVGAAPETHDYYAVDYLMAPELINRVVVRSDIIDKPRRRTISIPDLEYDMCGSMVTIENIALVAAEGLMEGQPLYEARWRGYTLFKSIAGDSIAVFTRDNATYADRRIPQGTVALTGVLQWSSYTNGKRCFHIRMRHESDCQAM